MSDSVRPHRLQPTRLLHPWDSPGKNPGVGCHFLLQCMKVEIESEVAQSYLTLSDPMSAAYQAPPSMGFSRQQYWSGVPLPSPDLGYRLMLIIKNKTHNGMSIWILSVVLVCGIVYLSRSFKCQNLLH